MAEQDIRSGDRGTRWTVILVPEGPGDGELVRCGCCGARYPVKRIGIWLGDGAALSGRICPECILRGPKGAAGRLAALVSGRVLSDFGRPGALEDWDKLAGIRAAALASMESFPLAARQAAVREMRERR